MATTVDDIRKLRELTGAGMMDCRSALTEAGGDVDKAVTILREKGIAKAAKRAGRETANGVVEAYLHRTGDYPPQVGVLVEINCESDFVAKGDNFRQLARELAIHIAAAKPRWINPEDVPEDVLDAERQIHAKRFESEGKPAAQIPKIVEGQINAFYKDNCLMKQLWVRDNKTPIENLVKENISRLQENIVVRRFARFDVKEA
ncbi:MAG: translation elongation factor Ts [Chloroflexi bacterium]|nr:MAG: translation elongation factor Ts [Chloroflexota bacterium]